MKSVFALKRTPTIRRPGNTSRKPRTTVSTSGSSGISYTKVAHTNPDAVPPSFVVLDSRRFRITLTEVFTLGHDLSR